MLNIYQNIQLKMYSINTKPSPPTDPDIIWIASIDVGKRNFAITITEYNIKTLHSLREPFSDNKYTDVTDGVSNNCRIVMMDLTDFIGSANKLVTQDIYLNIINYLDRIKEWLDVCLTVVIEAQVKMNPEAMKIEMVIYTWLVMRYELTKDIVQFPSRLKYFETDIPKTIKTKYNRKKWACTKTNEILTRNKDEAALTYIFKTHKPKKDDLSDTILQSIAFVKRVFVKQIL